MKTVSREQKFVDKLVEECTENVEEAKIAEITLTECNFIGSNSVENIHKCRSRTLYIVLFSTIFSIKIGICYLFFYYKYMSHNKKLHQDIIMSIKQQIININGTNKY